MPTLHTTVLPRPVPASVRPSRPTPTTVIAVTRRLIDDVLIGAGVLGIAVLLGAAVLLTWGNRFAADHVSDELSSQNIFFPSSETLTGQGRDDLVKYADQPVDTGADAEAYAGYIEGRLQWIADGATYAELGAVESVARADVDAAIDAGESPARIDELKMTAIDITAQRDALFKGETLRGLLLSTYAWSTVGTIAGTAAFAAYVAAALLAGLVGLGLLHRRRSTLAMASDDTSPWV